MPEEDVVSGEKEPGLVRRDIEPAIVAVNRNITELSDVDRTDGKLDELLNNQGFRLSGSVKDNEIYNERVEAGDILVLVQNLNGVKVLRLMQRCPPDFPGVEGQRQFIFETIQRDDVTLHRKIEGPASLEIGVGGLYSRTENGRYNWNHYGRIENLQLYKPVDQKEALLPFWPSAGDYNVRLVDYDVDVDKGRAEGMPFIGLYITELYGNDDKILIPERNLAEALQSLVFSQNALDSRQASQGPFVNWRSPDINFWETMLKTYGLDYWLSKDDAVFPLDFGFYDGQPGCGTRIRLNLKREDVERLCSAFLGFHIDYQHDGEFSGDVREIDDIVSTELKQEMQEMRQKKYPDDIELDRITLAINGGVAGLPRITE